MTDIPDRLHTPAQSAIPEARIRAGRWLARVALAHPHAEAFEVAGVGGGHPARVAVQQGQRAVEGVVRGLEGGRQPGASRGAAAPASVRRTRAPGETGSRRMASS